MCLFLFCVLWFFMFVFVVICLVLAFFVEFWLLIGFNFYCVAFLLGFVVFFKVLM